VVVKSETNGQGCVADDEHADVSPALAHPTMLAQLTARPTIHKKNQRQSTSGSPRDSSSLCGRRLCESKMSDKRERFGNEYMRVGRKKEKKTEHN